MREHQQIQAFFQLLADRWEALSRLRLFATASNRDVISRAASYDASASSASVQFLAPLMLMFVEHSQIFWQQVTCVTSFIRAERRCISSRTEISPDFVLFAVKTITSLDCELMHSWMIINLFSAYVNPSSSSSSSACCGGGRGRRRGKLISFAFLPSQSSTGQEALEFLLIGIRCSLTDTVKVSSLVKPGAAAV